MNKQKTAQEENKKVWEQLWSWRRNTKRGGAQGKQTERMCVSERKKACENIN